MCQNIKMVNCASMDGLVQPQLLCRYHSTLNSAVIVLKHSSGNQMENEMGETCSTYGGEERCIQGFGGVNWGKKIT